MMEDIIEAVAAHFQIPASAMLSRRKATTYSYPRMVAMYLCREVACRSYGQIGKRFSRDHTTAMHAHSRIKELMCLRQDVADDIHGLKMLIESHVE